MPIYMVILLFNLFEVDMSYLVKYFIKIEGIIFLIIKIFFVF